MRLLYSLVFWLDARPLDIDERKVCSKLLIEMFEFIVLLNPLAAP